MTTKILDSNEVLFSIVQNAEIACTNSNYQEAERLYTRAIQIDEFNASLFGNRSMTRLNVQNYDGALSDAKLSIQLDLKYAKGFYRLGIAYQHLNQHNNAIIAFAKGMSLDSKNFTFLQALIGTALSSPLQESLKPVMIQLKEINLSRNPFVVISVIGQDLLAHDYAEAAVEVLECAIVIDTGSLKLKGSVFSALSSALWMLGNYERAIFYMKEDLKVSQALKDTPGECRAFGNLGAAYFHQNHLDLAFENHNNQLQIAEKLQHKQLLASAHSGLGSIQAARHQNQLAVEHHKMSALCYEALHDPQMKSRELGKMSLALFSLGDSEGALRVQDERLQLCSDQFRDGGEEEALIYTEIAATYKSLNKYPEEISCLHKSVDAFQKQGVLSGEIKALQSLGHSAKSSGDWSTAVSAYEQLLEIALKTNDEQLEMRACAHLGIVHHQTGQFEVALKFQTRVLHLATKLGDVGSQGRAYGNIGNAYSASGLHEQAVAYHLKELEISRSVNDKESECSTHGNLAVTYQSLEMHGQALAHYKSQYELAREIGNKSNEARSLMNLANFYNTISEFEQAITYYDSYLSLSPVATHPSGHGRALYNLGFAHFSLHNFEEAVSCYEQSIAVAAASQDKVAIARAYCNLGLAKKSLGDFDSAIECQETFLKMSSELNSARGKLKALGNLGDICSARKEFDLSLSYYEQQLSLAEECDDKLVTAQSCCSLGVAYRAIEDLEAAAKYHERECFVYAELDETKSEYKAQGRLGAILTELESYERALSCYKRQIDLSEDHVTHAQAWGNLAITHINMRDYESARSSYESEIEALEQLDSKWSRSELCRAHCGVADCCEALDDIREVINFSQTALFLAAELKNLALMERACQRLSMALHHTNIQDSAITFGQHRVNICKLIGGGAAIASAYSDLGLIYSMNGQHEDALHCFSQQMKFAVELNDDVTKGDAACGMGSVYLLMGDYEKSLTFHKLDLELAQRNNDRPWQGRAYGNIASAYEGMKDFAAAIPCREQHLFIAKEEEDEHARLVALHGIGRNTLLIPDGDISRAVFLLQQAVLFNHGVKKSDQMVSTIYDLGIATWMSRDFQAATAHFFKAVEIAESLCSIAYSSMKSGVAPPSSLVDSYKLLCKSFSALLCLMCGSGQTKEALGVAERSRTFLHRMFDEEASRTVAVDEMIDYATKRRRGVVYFTLAAGSLFRWFVSPTGQVKFLGSTFVQKEDGDSVIKQLLCNLRDTLGVSRDDAADENAQPSDDVSRDDVKKPVYSELLSAYHSFQYDCTHIVTSRGRLYPSLDEASDWSESKSPFYVLHQLLLSKLDKELNPSVGDKFSDLVLVVEGDLMLVPYPMLKKRSIDRYLGDNFVLNLVPSFRSLLHRSDQTSSGIHPRCVTFADPVLSKQSIHDYSGDAASESVFTGQLFGADPSVGVKASKERVLVHLGSSEVLHFACPMSWEYPVGVVLGLSDVELDDERSTSSPTSPVSFNNSHDEERNKKNILLMSDILDSNLAYTKLVVIGAPYLFRASTHLMKSPKFSEHFSSYLHCLLQRGVKCVLLSLWPVPESASSLLLREFFKRLIEGSSTCSAFADAMATLRANQRFEHPSYWSGFVLIGEDIILDNHDASLVYSLSELLRSKSNLSRDTIQLLLHLIEKSLQVEHRRSDDVAMYTSQESVCSRVGDAHCWKSLFAAAGFQLQSSQGGVSGAIFFPSSINEEKAEILIRQLRPFLSISDQALKYLGQLVSSPQTSTLLRRWLTGAIQRIESDKKEGPHEEPLCERFVLERNIWQVDGVSELLRCAGFVTVENAGSSLALQASSSFNLQTAKNTLDCLNVLFGHVNYVNDAPTHKQPKSQASHQSKNLTDNALGLSLLLSSIVPSESDDALEFSSSFHSGGSVSSEVNQLENSIDEESKAEFGVMALDEPKIFTQVPKNSDLITPKAVLPQSPYSTPVNLPSPGDGFSPSKKFQFASTLKKLVHSPSASVVNLTNRTPPPQSRSFVPLSPRPNIGHRLSPSSGDFHGVQVCVVSPQRDIHPTADIGLSPSQDKYMSVLGDVSTGSKQKRNSTGGKVKAGLPASVEHSDPSSNPVSRSSSGSYKPSPSAASSLRSPPHQHEYSVIVDKLTRNSPKSPAEVRSNVTTTHTAFRLINQNVSSGHPKIQKYRVQTSVSTVSTLLSEDGDTNRGTVDGKSKQKKSHRVASPQSIFKRMGAMKVEDDRVQFV